MRLAFVLSDFYVQADESVANDPAFDALAETLRGAQRQPLRSHWYLWLSQQRGRRPIRTAHAAGADGSLALRAWWQRQAARSIATEQGRDDLPEVAAAWFVAPVHAVAGLNHVRLDGRGCLRLTAAELSALEAGFARDFADSSWRLVGTDDGRALLATTRSVAAVDTFLPQRWLGRDLRDALPRGPGAARLRALTAELELWLHQAPFNRERAARGLPPVTQLWPWDVSCPRAGPVAVRAEQPPGIRLLGRDAGAETLVKECGGAIGLLDVAEALRVDRPDGELTVVVLEIADAGGLERFAREWWLPALAALDRRALAELALIANDRQLTLNRWRNLRLWRRSWSAQRLLAS